MKILILVLFLGFISIPAYSQDYSEDNSYNPQENQTDDYALEQQKLDNEERARDAQMIQDQEPPPDTYDNSGEYGY